MTTNAPTMLRRPPVPAAAVALPRPVAPATPMLPLAASLPAASQIICTAISGALAVSSDSPEFVVEWPSDGYVFGLRADVIEAALATGRAAAPNSEEARTCIGLKVFAGADGRRFVSDGRSEQAVSLNLLFGAQQILPLTDDSGALGYPVRAGEKWRVKWTNFSGTWAGYKAQAVFYFCRTR